MLLRSFHLRPQDVSSAFWSESLPIFNNVAKLVQKKGWFSSSVTFFHFMSYDGPDVTPFIYTLMCVKQENSYRTTLNLTYMLMVVLTVASQMSMCMKGVTSGPS